MRYFWKKDKKDYPDFWKEYESYFDKKNERYTTISTTRFVALDTETTGFDIKNDRILSIGAVAIHGLTIKVSDQLECYVEQELFNEKTVAIHGIRKNDGTAKISEYESLQQLLAYLKTSTIIAHHAAFDKGMIQEALTRNGLGKLKNPFLDTGVLFKRAKHEVYASQIREKHYTLDELGLELKLPMSDRHTASGDAFITALAFLKILSRLKLKEEESTKYLFKSFF
ncbi:3'-5' exonuclease [Aquimarina sp. ERC-38]|uniref:3'-5' exonuclease n=1 Tax=Aquimarina sp. ERC-38 TaxID=2949996 RepID=UPI0022470B09|nr:3'-5' exonuclease [Aquimarina sp. ERC-38]UZO81635.1 3'-5' exonuclease [Aquimarina sp. ERC-38]